MSFGAFFIGTLILLYFAVGDCKKHPEKVKKDREKIREYMDKRMGAWDLIYAVIGVVFCFALDWIIPHFIMWLITGAAMCWLAYVWTGINNER